MKNELRELPEPWPQIQWIGTSRNGDFMGIYVYIYTHHFKTDLQNHSGLTYIYIHNMHIHISEDG